MNNTTLLTSASSIILDTKENYDTFGAIVFIIFVLCWYSLSAVFTLGIQTTTYRDISQDSTTYFTRISTRHSHEKNNNQRILGENNPLIASISSSNTNSILEELVDKKTREKLWNIYLGTSTGLNEKMNQADLLRVRNIQRQLAMMAKHNGNHGPDGRIKSISEHNLFDSHTESSISDIPSTEYRVRVRRRSETNQEILEQWQAAVQDLKVKETTPWTIQKLLIKRHLRRQRQLGDYQSLRKGSIS